MGLHLCHENHSRANIRKEDLQGEGRTNKGGSLGGRKKKNAYQAPTKIKNYKMGKASEIKAEKKGAITRKAGLTPGQKNQRNSRDFGFKVIKREEWRQQGRALKKRGLQRIIKRRKGTSRS